MKRRSRVVRAVTAPAVLLMITGVISAVAPPTAALAKSSRQPPVQHERALPYTTITPQPHPGTSAPGNEMRGESSWPTPGVASVTVPARLSGQHPADRPQRAGGLPVLIGPAGHAAAVAGSAAPLRVQVHDQASAARARVAGVLFSVQRASAAGGQLAVTVDYSGFANAGGANYGQRLRLVQLPACALSTPTVAACQVQTPVTASNDTRHQLLTTTLSSTASPAATPHSSPASANPPAQPTLATPAGSRVVLAAVAGPSGSNGSFTATSLAPSGSWSVSGSSGSFTWSYPLTLPPAAAGSDVTPAVALTYNSGTVDGRIASTNNQPSWVGEGWDYSPGYIERTYRSCSDDTSLPAASKTPDACWAGQVVTMSLGGSTTALVRDDSTGAWHPQADDGSRVQLVGAGPGGYQGEYWKITSTAGVAYYFGRDSLPGGGAGNTNATWTEPVYGAHPADPCNNPSGFASSSCTQAWRWNLDYVVDPHGNAAAYYYTAETNYYGADNATAPVAYTRGGYLKEIDYGLREESGSLGAAPAPERVSFAVSERCIPSGTITCDPAQFTAANASHWPDTPQDQQCAATGSCTNHAPTFWTRKRLTTISTAYATGSSYTSVDSYKLVQSFPTSGDPELRLESITRIGYAADGSAITLPTVSFVSQLMDNRVAGYNAQPAMQHWRLSQINTETGEKITVGYQQAGRAAPLCTASSVPADPSQDSKECFPVYWTPPYNSTPILDYFHKYVATEVDQFDANGTAPTRITTYTYLGAPAWHYDDNEITKPANRSYGQFRGYLQVQTRTGNPNHVSNGTVDAWTLSTATYYRGMDGDRLPGGQTRSATVTDSLGETVPDTNQYADTAREVQSFNGDTTTQLATTITTPTAVGITATRARSGLPDLTAVLVRTAITRSYTTLAAGGTRNTQTSYGYDGTGRRTQRTDTGTGVPALCTTTRYAENTTSWIRDRVSETIASAQTCPANGSAPIPVLRDTRSYYDGSNTLGTVTSAGDATETDTATSGVDPSIHWAISTASYDPLGRTLSTTVAAAPGDNRTTSIAYTPADGGPLTQTVTTNPLGQASTTVVDPGRGVSTETRDVAGHPTNASYDPLGRLTAVWRPGQTKGSTPATATYSYQYGPAAPLAVTSKTLVDPGNGSTPGYITSISIYDAFGQLRQTQADAVGGGRVITDSYPDSHGWITATNNHWYTTGTPSTTPITTAQSGIEDSTRTGYDGAGRPLLTTEYKGTTATWSTRTIYSGDRTTVIPPAGAVETTTITDARGHTSELDQWSSPPTITGNTISGGTATRTTYQYDPLGQQTQLSTPAGTPQAATWSTSYDLAGRVISKTDPDTGTTDSSYDDAGELTATTDANGQTLAYRYDPLGRKTGEYADNIIAGTQLAGWSYDSLQTGKPTAATRYTATGNYTTAVTGYDTAGNPTGTATTIPASQGNLAGTYTTSATWTSTHLTATQTPAPGGSLPTETIYNKYDNFGEPTAETSSNAYVSASSYSPYGEANQYTLGVNKQTAWLTYNRDAQTRRITSVNLSAQTAIPQLENTAYSYDPAGNPTRSIDTQGGGTGAPVQTQCYTYNNLDQLTQAWSATDNCATDPATLGNNTKIGGPQPYWDTWSFDAAGGRTQQTQHAIPGATGGDTTTTYSNGVTTPAAHAHALAATSTTGPGAGNSSYSYDAAGNTTSRTQPAGNQSISYTPDNRTDTITTATGTVSYLYDADGTQLIRHDTGTGTTTLYLPGEELSRNDTTGAITGTRYYTHNGTIVALRVAHTNSTYLYADPHGTNTTAVPTTQTGTATPIRQHFAPYGNPLGTPTGTWPDQHAFLNKPTNTSTGLDDVGARNYDPTLGRFTTVDPILDTTSPQQMNGYSYANNNPVTLSDPNGTDPPPPPGCDLACRNTSYCGSSNCDDTASWGSGTPAGPGNGGSSTGGGGASGGPVRVDPRKVMVTIKNPNYDPQLCQAYFGGNGPASMCDPAGQVSLAMLQANLQNGGTDYCGSLSWLCTATGLNDLLRCVNNPEPGSCGGAVVGIASDVFILAKGAKLATLLKDAGKGAAGDWPELTGMLQDASKGKGNFGIGTATQEQAQAAGRAWVGSNATLASDGTTWVSQDGLRQYRAPSYKPNLGGWQANLEYRLVPRGAWQGNGHIDITDPP